MHLSFRSVDRCHTLVKWSYLGQRSSGMPALILKDHLANRTVDISIPSQHFIRIYYLRWSCGHGSHRLMKCILVTERVSSQVTDHDKWLRCSILYLIRFMVVNVALENVAYWYSYMLMSEFDAFRMVIWKNWIYSENSVMMCVNEYSCYEYIRLNNYPSASLEWHSPGTSKPAISLLRRRNAI